MGIVGFFFPISNMSSSKNTRVDDLIFESKKFSTLRVSRRKDSNRKYQNEGNTLEPKRMEVERGDPKVFRNPPVACF